MELNGGEGGVGVDSVQKTNWLYMLPILYMFLLKIHVFAGGNAGVTHLQLNLLSRITATIVFLCKFWHHHLYFHFLYNLPLKSTNQNYSTFPLVIKFLL